MAHDGTDRFAVNDGCTVGQVPLPRYPPYLKQRLEGDGRFRDRSQPYRYAFTHLGTSPVGEGCRRQPLPPRRVELLGAVRRPRPAVSAATRSPGPTSRGPATN